MKRPARVKFLEQNKIMDGKNCVWIGVAAVIEKDTLLYSDLKKINDYLAKEMMGGFGYSSALRPHLNFYDLSIPAENLNKVKDALDQTFANQKPVECKIAGINFFKFGMVYVEIEKNEDLANLQKEILETVNSYRGDCLDLDYQKLVPVLSDSQKESLNKYGNPYMTDFKPHISVGYLPNKKDSLEAIISGIEPILTVKKFTISKLDLVKGRTYNDIEIICEYQFL